MQIVQFLDRAMNSKYSPKLSFYPIIQMFTKKVTFGFQCEIAKDRGHVSNQG